MTHPPPPTSLHSLWGAHRRARGSQVPFLSSPSLSPSPILGEKTANIWVYKLPGKENSKL